MSESQTRPNIFFRLVLIASAVFIFTILSMVAVSLGDPETPVARFLNTNGFSLISYEVGAIFVTGLSALYFDRRQILKDKQQADLNQES